MKKNLSSRISTKLDPYWDISLELLNGKVVTKNVFPASANAASAFCAATFDDESNDSSMSTATLMQMTSLNNAGGGASISEESGSVSTDRERSLEECLQK